MQAANSNISIARWRWAILTAWLLAAGLLMRFVSAPDPAAWESANFLPPDAPYSQAQEALRKAFPNSYSLSEIVVIFERPGGRLTKDDLRAVDGIAGRIKEPGAEATKELLREVSVLKPGDIPLEPNPLISPVSSVGQAALVRVNVPANFITKRSDSVVLHVRGILEHTPLPPGLRAAITGSSGFGHDYALAAQQSHRRTLYVTLLAVAIILLLVYRAPLAAMIPLIAISLAAVVAVKVLAMASRVGLHVGTAEEIFVLVLIYGAGVDYSLLLISRFREFLHLPMRAGSAADKCVAAALAAILAAAATNILGLLMLCFAQHRIFRTTGPAVAVALFVALLASLTLVPALLAIFGKAVFWPQLSQPKKVRFSAMSLRDLVWWFVKWLTFPQGHQRLWQAIGRIVTTRPLLVMLVTLGAMAYPVYRGANQTWVYDTLASIEAEEIGGVGNAAAGLDIARRHWPVGEISPVTLLVRAPKPLTPPQWRIVSKKVTAALLALRAPDDSARCPVANVRGLSQPLGKDTPPLSSLLLRTRQDFINATYIGTDSQSTRLDVLMSTPALELDTMRQVRRVRGAAQAAANEAIAQVTQTTPPGDVLLAGATAEMIDTRAVTQRDFYLIAVLVLGVILVIMFVLLRQVLLSLFMVVSTVVSYFATLGLCHWLLISLPPLVGMTTGFTGLDWKVEVFLFVVMVSVGQDYNIFLAGRLMQEARNLPLRDAAREALIHTGPVISSAGLIMAATLGSLMAGHLALLTQLGFALALGMLIDTFIVRPLLLPAFAVLTGRNK